MKKLLLPIISMLAIFTACDSENEFHQTSFNKTSITMYADQVKDSVILFYADDWTARLNDASWLSLLNVVKNDNGEILSEDKVSTLSGIMERGAMLMATPIYVTAEPNTSGKIRFTNLLISSHEAGAITITQLPLLNIAYPNYQFREGTEASSENVFYEGTYTDEATEGIVVFTVYRNGATLTSDQDWVTPEADTFEAGYHEVKLTLQPNTTGEKRTATLTLTSGGISVPITIIQQKDENTLDL